jgi:hypothetical protein
MTPVRLLTPGLHRTIAGVLPFCRPALLKTSRAAAAVLIVAGCSSQVPTLGTTPPPAPASDEPSRGAACTFAMATIGSGCAAWPAPDSGDIDTPRGFDAAACACVPGWTRQFGSAGFDGATSVSATRAGDALVAGFSEEAAQTHVAFVRHYTKDGTLLWTRDLGSSVNAIATSVSEDGAGNVIVVGSILGATPGDPWAGDNDAFVRIYAGDGTLRWTQQFGSPAHDDATSVGVDALGNVVVAGHTFGALLPGEDSAGDMDAFLRMYASDGTLRWTRQFGSAGADVAHAVSVDADGNVLVAGDTLGILTPAASRGGRDAFIRKYAGDGSVVWTRQFGTNGDDSIASMSLDATGGIVVAGYTNGGLEDGVSSGDYDAFVRKYASDGTPIWTHQFSSTTRDTASSVSVGTSGDVVVAGTAGTPEPETPSGGSEAFVRAYRSDGTLLWTRHFGSAGLDQVSSVGVDPSGNLFVAGNTGGTLHGQTSMGGTDAFVMMLVRP